MSILEELQTMISALGFTVRTAEYVGENPDTFVVVTPLTARFDCFADDLPTCETHEVKISLFSKENDQKDKDVIVKALLKNEFCITERRYVEVEKDAGYHHFDIDASKSYTLEEEI